MNTTLNLNNMENIEKIAITEFTEQAYLDYSMYVILDRALPHIGDGLKPVQRRIIFAMSELNLNNDAKYKKSARTIGDVLGKFHPHGDSACYEAMVLMAQPFSYRYPLIDGQGNFGSPDDPKSFAAMRYTEARLSRYANTLLSELEQGTIEWVNNFDGTMQEPKTLPAQLPNVLLNGATGIAVGMATDIPPHNVIEVVNACIELLDNPNATLADIMHYIKGPDYPTCAEIITPQEDLIKMYQTGQGSIRMRAAYVKEGNDIVITALPYLVSGAKILEQIAQQMQSKKLPLITDLRDESDHENPIRLIIVPRSNKGSNKVDIEQLMAHLFATTELERTYRVNLNIIGLDNKPKVRGLIDILQIWLSYRKNIVKNRLQHRLQKVIAQLHILDGYLIAFLNLDQIINIIRHQDSPKNILINNYKLSDIQVDAILNMKLRSLSKLEETNIKQEQQKLLAEREKLEDILNSENKLKTLIKKELKDIIKNFPDNRRSPITIRKEAKVLESITTVAQEPMTIILSNKGWVRAGKGHDIDPKSLHYKAGDEYKTHAHGISNKMAVFMDSFGRAYALAIHTLPSIRSSGEPLTSRLSPEQGATFEALMVGEDKQRFLLIASNGYGFITQFNNLLSKNRKGKAIINITKGAHLLPPIALPLDIDINNYLLILIASDNKDNKLLVCSIKNIPTLSKGKGKKLFNISASNSLSLTVAAIIPTNATDITLIAARGKLQLKSTELREYLGEVGSNGKKLPKKMNKILKIDF